MDLELAGKIALVTGGSRGIGRACALALAKEGADVTVAYASNEEAAKSTIAAIEQAGGKASAAKLDVADPESCKNVVEETVKAKGNLHILVSNAGISIDGLLLRFKDEDFDKVFKTNVYGTFYLIRAASRAMMRAKWGRMIFMGSVVGETGNAGQIPYAGTKAALDGMARSVARELASRNITANVVAPGFVDTDMTKVLPEQVKTAMLASIPAGRMGLSEEIADVVTFLASERARYITGQVLNVNGGMYM